MGQHLSNCLRGFPNEPERQRLAAQKRDAKAHKKQSTIERSLHSKVSLNYADGGKLCNGIKQETEQDTTGDEGDEVAANRTETGMEHWHSANWSPVQVGEWLSSCGLSTCARKFAEQEIDGMTLLQLEELLGNATLTTFVEQECLWHKLGLELLGHRIKSAVAVRTFRLANEMHAASSMKSTDCPI